MFSHSVRFCWWHTFAAHRPISRPQAEKESPAVYLPWMFVCVSVRSRVSTHLGVVRGWWRGPQTGFRIREGSLNRGPSGELDKTSFPRRASRGGRIQALSMHNALEASFYWQPPLPLSTPAGCLLIKNDTSQCPDIHIAAHLQAQTDIHTSRNLLIKKCVSWRLTPKRNPAGRNWNNLLAYKFSLTVSLKAIYLSNRERLQCGKIDQIKQLWSENESGKAVCLSQSQGAAGKQTKLRDREWDWEEKEII